MVAVFSGGGDDFGMEGKRRWLGRESRKKRGCDVEFERFKGSFDMDRTARRNPMGPVEWIETQNILD